MAISIADIQQDIHSKLRKIAPAFERYGEDMYYIQLNPNACGISFEKNIEKVYFFKCITNSHVLG